MDPHKERSRCFRRPGPSVCKHFRSRPPLRGAHLVCRLHMRVRHLVSNRKVFIGTTVLAVGNACRYVLQLVLVPVLARILGPSSYGGIALATPFFFFLMLFSDLGLGASLVRAPELTRTLESSVFWIVMGLALALACLLAVAAHPIADLLGQPALGGILLALAPLFLLSSATIVPSARLQRAARFKAVACADILSTVGGAAVALATAYCDWGSFALVAQQWTLWLVRVGVFAIASGFFPILRLDLSAATARARFGIGLVGSQVITFLGTNLDNVLVGTLLGPSELGRYALAYQLVNIPCQILGGIHYAIMPAVAENQRNGLQLARLYFGSLRMILLVIVPALTGLALTSDLIIELALTEAWRGTGRLVALLTPFGIVQMVFVLNSAMVIGVGRTEVEFQISLVRSLFLLIGISTGLAFGSAGIAAGVSAGTVVSGVICTYLALETCRIPKAESAAQTLEPLLASGFMIPGVIALRTVIADRTSPPLDFVVCVVIGVVLYIGVLALLPGAKLREDVLVIRRSIFTRR